MVEHMAVEEIIEREIAAGIPFGAFHRQWLLERAPEKVRRYLELAKTSNIVAVRQGFGAMDLNDINTADFNARNTFTTEVNLLGGDINGAPTQALTNQFCAIPANDARAGKAYMLTFGGIYGTTGTPTIIFTPRWGNNVTIGTNISLGVSSTYTTASGVAAQPFFGQFLFGIKTSPPGATLGTGKGHGFVALGITAATGALLTMGKTLATIDTTGQGTAGCGLQMGVTWGTSSASNTITPENWLIQSLN
jgi:hypothetical protein